MFIEKGKSADAPRRSQGIEGVFVDLYETRGTE